MIASPSYWLTNTSMAVIRRSARAIQRVINRVQLRRYDHALALGLQIMETRDVATIIALMLGPVIMAALVLWCALGGWIGS